MVRVLLCIALAAWPVWLWYARATLDDSNDGAGLLAAASALAVAVLARRQPVLQRPLMLPALLALGYLACSLTGMPATLRALAAVLTLAAVISAWRLGRRLDPGLAALCMLALPIGATLQFYAGYPLRVIAGALAAGLLRMNGLAVTRDGALLVWDGQLIAIDAPCSGVRMLWGGLYLACALAAWARLDLRMTIIAASAAVAIVIAANALRAAALFYMEAGIVALPAHAHGAIGVVAFDGAAGAIFAAVSRLRPQGAHG